MDFHEALAESVVRFPGLDGIIFVDPDGESIIYEAPRCTSFDVRLTGAKMSILMQSMCQTEVVTNPRFLEIGYQGKFFLYVELVQRYSITAIVRDITDKYRLKRHLLKLAHGFNQEIF